MIHTNHNYFLLSKEEIYAQEECMRDLRQEHSLQLIRSGLVGRAIRSLAASNRTIYTIPTSAPTIFYPFRRTYHRLPQHITEAVDNDCKFDAPLTQMPCHAAYVYCVGKIDQNEEVYGSSGYIIGAGQASEARCVPGLLPCDVRLVRSQLVEIAAFAVNNKLTALDRSTLCFGPGELLTCRS